MSRAGYVDGSGGADALLPFSKEPNTRIEPTFVRVGESPLRIYKNEYDKHPVSFLPKLPSCVIREDDPSVKEILKFVKENCGDKPAGTLSRSFQPSLWSAYSTPEEASSSSKDASSQDASSQDASSKDDPSPANKED